MLAVSALEKRDLKSFIDAITEEEFDVNQEFGDEIPKSLIHLAIEEASGKDEFVSALIALGAKADTKNIILETILFHDAVRNHAPELLKNNGQYTLLQFASEQKRHEIVVFLFEKRSRPL